MDLNQRIRAFQEAATGYAPKSKLEPFLELIRTLRKKRWTYAQIADALQREFGVRAAASTIHEFLQIRAKKSKSEGVVNDTLAKPSTNPPIVKRPRFNLDA